MRNNNIPPGHNTVNNTVHTTAYLYKLTFLRVFTFLFSSLLILESLNSFFYIESPYLKEVWNFSEEKNHAIISSTLFFIGSLGVLISTFLFEYVQSRKFLYVPLSILNVFLGILFTQIVGIMTSSKELIFNNKYITLYNHEKIVKSAIYFRDWIQGKDINYINKSLKEQFEIPYGEKNINLKVLEYSKNNNLPIDDSIKIVGNNEIEALKIQVRILAEQIKTNSVMHEKTPGWSSTILQFLSTNWLPITVSIIVVSGVFAFGYKMDIVNSVNKYITAVGKKNEIIDAQFSNLIKGQKEVTSAIEISQNNFQELSSGVTNNLNLIKDNQIEMQHKIIDMSIQMSELNNTITSMLADHVKVTEEIVVLSRNYIELSNLVSSMGSVLDALINHELGSGQIGGAVTLNIFFIFCMRTLRCPTIIEKGALGGEDEQDPVDPNKKELGKIGHNVDEKIDANEILKAYQKSMQDYRLKQPSRIQEVSGIIESYTPDSNSNSNSNTLPLSNPPIFTQNSFTGFSDWRNISPQTFITPDLSFLHTINQELPQQEAISQQLTIEVAESSQSVVEAISGNGPFMQFFTWIIAHPVYSIAIALGGAGIILQLYRTFNTNSNVINIQTSIPAPAPGPIINIHNHIPESPLAIVIKQFFRFREGISAAKEVLKEIFNKKT